MRTLLIFVLMLAAPQTPDRRTEVRDAFDTAMDVANRHRVRAIVLYELDSAIVRKSNF
jgi:hypothetical protein